MESQDGPPAERENASADPAGSFASAAIDAVKGRVAMVVKVMGFCSQIGLALTVMFKVATALKPAVLATVTVKVLSPTLALSGVPVKFPWASICSHAGPPLVSEKVNGRPCGSLASAAMEAVNGMLVEAVKLIGFTSQIGGAFTVIISIALALSPALLTTVTPYIDWVLVCLPWEHLKDSPSYP